MGNSASVRLTENYKEFAKKANKNMIKADIIDEPLTAPKFADRIVSYFKAHNESYVEFIKMEDKKDG